MFYRHMTGFQTSTPTPVTAAPPVSVEPGHAANPQLRSHGGAEGAAALVELTGVSPITVENYEQSVPPNLATAAALASQLATRGGLSTAEQSSVFTLMDRSAVLALANA